MIRSNVNPQWPIGRKVAILDGTGEPATAYAYRGPSADWRYTEGVNDLTSPVVELKSATEKCPMCGELYIGASEYTYGLYKTIVCLYECGSAVGWGRDLIVFYSMTDKCLFRIEDII